MALNRSLCRGVLVCALLLPTVATAQWYDDSWGGVYWDDDDYYAAASPARAYPADYGGGRWSYGPYSFEFRRSPYGNWYYGAATPYAYSYGYRTPYWYAYGTPYWYGYTSPYAYAGAYEYAPGYYAGPPATFYGPPMYYYGPPTYYYYYDDDDLDDKIEAWLKDLFD